MSDVRQSPPDRQCRAAVAGQVVRGANWSPPHRCRSYARENGYCRRHWPADQSDEAAPAADAL